MGRATYYRPWIDWARCPGHCGALDPLGPNWPRRTKTRLPLRQRQPFVVAPQPNVVWAVGLMSDTLYSGRRLRTMNVLDAELHEGLAIEVDMSLPAEREIRMLEQVVSWRG